MMLAAYRLPIAAISVATQIFVRPPVQLIRYLLFQAVLVAVMSCVFWPTNCRAIEPVSGSYLFSYGKAITLEFRILYPPPASLIIEQYFPPGLGIVSATPAPQKFSSKLGKMKWIFKELQPGTHVIRIDFDQPVRSADLQAVIRYNSPGRGLYMESTILP